jgi:glycosyltransferase involved in cell wall biosynthesis
MDIAMINIPIETPWLGQGSWVTVPPAGYGGIQWVVANLIDGLLELGHRVYLLGAPGSLSNHRSLIVLDLGSTEDILTWLASNSVDIIHDHSNRIPLETLFPAQPYVSTHHFTGTPRNPVNAIYCSSAQCKAAGSSIAPVVRIPVNPARYRFSAEKEDYLLALCRVSPWKGALEAAQYAEAAGLRLILAGPAWEGEYFHTVMTKFRHVVDYRGEVRGMERLNLLAKAKALLVLSQPVMGLWGDIWCEPGATVVSEASVSGTPVISSDNGCLPEIVPHVGVVIPTGEELVPVRVRATLSALPSAEMLQSAALREWHYLKIAQEYEQIYMQVIGGRTWR